MPSHPNPPTLLIAVLAAGASRRLGRPKQLVTLSSGETLVHRQCRIGLEAAIGSVVAILGCEAEACASALAGLTVETRINASWEEGFASSIREATHAAMERRSDGLMIVLGDQYRIDAKDLAAIASAWRAAGVENACRSWWTDGFGPPVILPAALFPAALKLQGDSGARELLAAMPRGQVIDVSLPNAAFDLDRPEQLADL